MANRYPRYLKKLNAGASDFGETALAALRLQAQGLTARDIAARLSITADTVKYHTRENYRKLGAANRTDAILAARGLGIL